MSDKANIVFCIDQKYTQCLGITIASLLTHNNASQLRLYIVAPELEAADIAKLNAVGNMFGAELIFRQGEDARIAGLREHLHISRATYYRLLLPDILHDVHKVIYMDCDLVVEANIQELWQTDVSRVGAAGLDETNSPHAARLNILPDFYMNAGVLVLNLDFWRECHIKDKTLDWLANNPNEAILLEQDALNVTLRNNKARIDRKWNLNPVPEHTLDLLTQYPERIVHFAGPFKPWHKYFSFELQELYKKYVNMTPWTSTFKPQEPSNTAQACFVGNQLHKRMDYTAACQYYQLAINLRIKDHPMDSKLLLDCINGGHRHFNHNQYFDACEHYRSCLSHWGYLTACESPYAMPGMLDGVYSK